MNPKSECWLGQKLKHCGTLKCYYTLGTSNWNTFMHDFL